MANPCPWIVDVTDQTFRTEVLERSKEVPVVVDFWAVWCGPCRILGPLLEKEAEARKGSFVLAKVDVDHNQALARMFRIQGIPAVKAFVNGEPSLEFTGVVPEPELKRFLDDLTGGAAPQDDGAQELEASDPTQAEASYLAKLEEEPRDPAANLGLARLSLAKNEEEAAAERLGAIDPKKSDDHRDEIQRLEALVALKRLARPLGGIDEAQAKHEAEPEDAELRYALGCLMAAAGEDYPDALAMLISAGERSKELAKTKVREAMVHVFYVVGSRSPLADEYRDKLASLVF